MTRTDSNFEDSIAGTKEDFIQFVKINNSDLENQDVKDIDFLLQRIAQNLFYYKDNLATAKSDYINLIGLLMKKGVVFEDHAEENNDKSEYVLLPKSLTAENGAKGLLSGEFFEKIEIDNPNYCECGECENCKEFPDEQQTITRNVPVRWSTIKDIYAKIVTYFSNEI